MAYDRNHVRLTWGGRIGTNPGSPEVWQTGLKLARFGSPVGVDTPTLPNAGDLAELWTAVISVAHAHAYAGISQGAVLTWIRAALVGTDGKENMTTLPPVLFEGPAPVGGAVGGNTASSPQDALAITLWSGQTTGKGNYGRMYMPWCALVASPASGALVEVEPALTYWGKAIVDGVNAWATSIGTTSFDGGRVAVLSKTGVSKEVQYVRAGAIKDTIRRRRNKLTEAPVTAAVAPAA